ncbi:MAG: glycosyl hydrolase repeat-containing glycosyl hydrolase [Acidobacteria bacterium]|nr:glycosyl hydrolase repeat-containing glycosyl hydrolase [Acidobacteriota bacterium]
MPAPKNITPKSGDVVLLVGTMKGAFIIRADGARTTWEVGGPYFPGKAIYAFAYDDRNGRTRLWAAVNSSFWGSYLSSSDDFGATWSEPEAYHIRFPEDADASVKQIWQITLGHEDEPDTLYCGVEPAALFKSTDAGATWALDKGLYDHPHRPQWQPGGGGLCLHTILPDPANSKRMHIAISTGGVYRTDDGGANWQARNIGVRAQFLPEGQQYPEFGQCVHKIVSHPSSSDRMFLQNHWGLYRSDDAGDSWSDIANGVPSDFGFAMEIDNKDPNMVFIVPLESDEFRCTPEARLRVYRTRNAGDSWEPLTNGLPQENAFETVLRDGLTGDKGDPMGLYFGTRSGKLFGSNNTGESWQTIEEGLPPIACVKTATIA